MIMLVEKSYRPLNTSLTYVAPLVAPIWAMACRAIKISDVG
jgi:hypothetical protein